MRLFNIFFPASVIGLLVSETVLVSSGFLLAVLVMSDVDPAIFLLYEGGLARITLVVAGVLMAIYYQDLYDDLRVRSRTLLMQQFCLVVGVAFLLQSLWSYVNPEWVLPRWVMIIGSGLTLITLPAWRLLYNSVVLDALGGHRILFLGANGVVKEIAARLTSRPELGMTVIGCLEEGEVGEAELACGPHLGPISALGAVVGKHKPDLIVVGMTERRQRLPILELLNFRLSGLPVEEAASTYESVFGRICARGLQPAQFVFSSRLGPRPRVVRLQAAYSTLIAALGVLLTAPLMIVVAALVKLTSPGPVLHRQKRVGLRDQVFVLYKFRSMCVDAEAKTGAVWASRDDPRVTTVGRWLRRLRLDELPQLFNVLRGEMSIVGPRPERPEFVDVLSEKIPFYRHRHCVRPGITGWAQINHKYGDTLEDTVTKMEYDLYYIKNLGPSLDFYIIFHTLKVMLLFKGAH